MLVLSVEENRSQGQDLSLICWVFEGDAAHVDDVLTCAAQYTVKNYGKDKEALRFNYSLNAFHNVHLIIRRIRKHTDWSEMPVGYSGLFNFEVKKVETSVLLNRFRCWESTRQQPTLDVPLTYQRLFLFDTEETARAYTEKILHEHAFNPEFQ